jgi:hypothetical protein
MSEIRTERPDLLGDLFPVTRPEPMPASRGRRAMGSHHTTAPTQDDWLTPPWIELWSMLVCGVQAATCSSAACTGSPSRKRTPWITWASRCEPSNRRQLRSAALASL